MNIIIHMCDPYPNEGPNAVRMQTFYDVFTRLGHKVYVLAPDIQPSHQMQKDVFYCPVIPLKSKSTLNRLLNGLSFGFTSFFASLRLGTADVVLTTSPPPLISPFGWLIAKIKRAKLIYDVRDVWPDIAWEMGSFGPGSIYSKGFAAIRDFMLRHADLVTTVSEGKVKKLRGYAPRAEIIDITNGLNERFLDNTEDPEVIARYHLDEVFSCVYIGNLGLAQGLRQLLAVAEKAKAAQMRVQFLLFGGGVEEAKLKDMARQKGLDNVVFAGRLPNTEIYTVLKHAKISFVSLVNDKLLDSVPTKMFEALGVGCPVLLAAAGEAAAILEQSGLGIAVRPNDEEALWNAFLQMFDTMPQVLANRERARALMLTKYSRQKAALRLEKEITERFKRRE